MVLSFRQLRVDACGAPCLKTCQPCQDAASRPRNCTRSFLLSASCQANFHNRRGQSGLCSFRDPVVPAEPQPNAGSSGVSNIPLQARLQSFGLAGIVSYGLLNTIYYVAAFLFFWVHVAKVPKGLGLKATATRFVGVMGLTWAGSQLTKVARLAGALVLAPVMDMASVSLQSRLQLRSKRSALVVVIIGCLAAAIGAFGMTILAWA